MGESACLMHAFSYASGISNEAKQGNPMHALGDSISFGRFMTESLSWDKWSAFSQNRYVEEAQRYAQPGSVAQKKALFEAHYKKIAAKKAAEALLQQENDSRSTDLHSIVNVQGCNAAAEMEIGEEKKAEIVAEDAAALENPMESESVKEIVSVVKQNTAPEKSMELIGNSVSSSQLEIPLLKGFKSSQEASSPLTKKKPAFAPSKPCIQLKEPKVQASPAKPATSHNHKKGSSVTPITRNNSPKGCVDKKRSTLNSLRSLIYATPAKEPDKPTTPAARRAGSSRVAPSSYKASKVHETPLMTPLTGNNNGAFKNASATPRSENRSCSKSLSACRNKLQSPTLSVPFNLRTEERAARRKQKLEEKFNADVAQRVQLQTRLKDKAENELRKLRQTLCFKARPLPDFYKERETPKSQTKNAKIPLTHPESPKLGRKPRSSSSSLQGKGSLRPGTHSTKSIGHKNAQKKNSQIPNPGMMITHENTSPNIQRYSSATE
ncbi:protein WVD2-like 7 isoform X2 [Diospyros lotus]|uniref:protein WVD2-like 7 isoform X2 n=1 Tax=Diospyros lotus TaxID=55363 RepID=UPI002254DA07|nr:protein WVD2-like 7 isoform X2 [Diospyros lotus]